MNQATELFSDGIHPSITKLCFDKLNWKLAQSKEAKISKEDCELAEREYRRFLTLKKLYPKKELVPSKLVDEYWHAHILDTESYRKDCHAAFGYFLDHYPYLGIYGEDDKKELISKYQETMKLYKLHFGDSIPSDNSESRCECHPCHAPTECACRAPGTCK